MEGVHKSWIALLVVSTIFLVLREFLFQLKWPPRLVLTSDYVFQPTIQAVDLNQQVVSMREIPMIRNYPTAKWIVLDGLSSVCHDVGAFAESIDWRVILVSAYNAQIPGCRFPRCILLNQNTYKSLLSGFVTTNLVTRPTKLAGYLLAMSQGAEVILDAQCGTFRNVSTVQHPLLKYPSLPPHSLLYNRPMVFNAFQHFGYETLFPHFLENLSKSVRLPVTESDCYLYEKGCAPYHTNTNMYYIADTIESFIWQSVSTSYASCFQSDPLKMKSSESTSIISPVSIISHAIAPLDSGFTLFPRNAFALMFLPVEMSHWEQDIFRTVFVHGIRGHLSLPVTYINDGTVYQNLNCSLNRSKSHRGLLMDLKSAMNIGMQCNGIINSTNIYACAIKISNSILNHLLGADKAEVPINLFQRMLNLFIAWMDDLRKIKIGFPSLRTYSKFDIKRIFKVKYSLHPKPNAFNVSDQIFPISKQVFKAMQNVCANFSQRLSPTADKWESPIMPDIMLVVVLNYVFLFDTLPYLEYVHRLSFKHVVYCGTNITEFKKFAKIRGFTYVTFIDGFTDSWYLMYECMAHTMKLGIPVKGYLQIGDDVLLNVQKLAKLPLDKIWMPLGFTKRKLNDTLAIPFWYYWQSPYGRPAILKTFSELQKSAQTLPNEEETAETKRKRVFATNFINTYVNNIDPQFVINRAMDIFYIPEKYRLDFIRGSKIFRDNRVMVELAIPILHLGLAPRKEVIYMYGESVWGRYRDESWKFYRENTTFFIHPFKSMQHLSIFKGRQFFCLEYLPNLVNLSKSRT